MLARVTPVCQGSRISSANLEGERISHRSRTIQPVGYYGLKTLGGLTQAVKYMAS